MAQMQIFVSHSSTDKAACDAFVQALRGAGANVWYDEQNLGAGHLLEEIQREVQARPIFIVLLSKASFGSPWVRRETTWAFNLANREPNRLILPVTIGAIEPSDFNGSWLFLEDFKRVEAPGYKPYPIVEAVARTLKLLELTPAGQRPAPVTPPQPAETLDDLLTKGKALTAQKKFAEAIPFFERATRLDARSFDAWGNLGWCYCETARWQDALSACDRALALDAKQAWVWNNKGFALWGLKRPQEALAAFEQALALNPNYVVAWNGKGATLRDLKRPQEALAAYEKALALDPNDAMGWNGKGASLRDLMRLQEALTAYDQALALDPAYAYPWTGKGAVLHDLKRDADAVAAYDKAIGLDPTFAIPWANKAISLRALGRTREAEEAERRAKALGSG